MFGIYARHVLATQMFSGTGTGALPVEKPKMEFKNSQRNRVGQTKVITCGECHSHKVKCVAFPDTRYPYGENYGPVYLCLKCFARVGCHKGTTIPLGIPCGDETRELRKQLHQAFDPLWKSKFMTRVQAYRWLQYAMELSPDDCHIAKFNAWQCKKALTKVNLFRKRVHV